MSLSWVILSFAPRSHRHGSILAQALRVGMRKADLS
jgi:hypothetical protein